MVVLKLCSYERKRPPMSMIAADLNMSPSEIHAAIKRLQQARLLHGPELQEKPNLSALEEFLLHGVKYEFPAEHGQVTRGVPTSFASASAPQEVHLAGPVHFPGLANKRNQSADQPPNVCRRDCLFIDKEHSAMRSPFLCPEL